MKKIVFLLAFALIIAKSYAQNPLYLISQQGTVVDCAGDFFDSGNSGAAYGANENFIITFQSSNTPNDHIKMTFNNFDVDPGDTLICYDGPNTSAPVIGKYNNNNIPPNFVNATIYNASGDLTFQFKSDGTLQNAGWFGSLVCIPACQKIIAAFDPVLTVPHPNDSNYVDICIGNPITFAALGNATAFPENNVLYAQDPTTSTYLWDFGDGNTATGQVVSHTYTTVRGYDVAVTITDVRGCFNSNYLGGRVRISKDPITYVHPVPDICSSNDTTYMTLGYDINSVVVIAPINSTQSASQRYDSTTFIPDGPNCPPGVYNTYVTFTQFLPTQTIQSANDVLSICVDIEHSFAGDLGFSIICPNGQSVIMDGNDHSGGSFLGQADDINDGSPTCSPAANPPGSPWVYCWSQLFPQQGSMNNLDAGVSPIPATDTVNHTNYLTPDNSFSGLIGCPLNGTWNIQITDNWGIDNGYIFWWELNLDPSLLPGGWSYQVPIDTVMWSGSFLHIINDTTVMVIPNAGGLYPYTVTVVDAFGCSYDTTLSIQVVQTPHPDLGHDTVLCGNNLVYQLNAGPGDIYTWSTGNNTQQQPVTTTGFYSVTVADTNLSYTLSCQRSDTVFVRVLQSPAPIVWHDTCTLIHPITLSAANPGFHYLWSTGDTTQTITVNTSGQYTVSVADEFGYNCQTTSTIHVSIKPPPVNLGPDTCVANTTPYTLPVNGGSPGFHYTWSTGATSQTIIAEPSVYSYSVTVTDDPGHNCDQSDHVNVRIIPTPDFTIGPDTSMCSYAKMFIHPRDVNGYFDDPRYQYSYTYYWEPFGQTTRDVTLECLAADQVYPIKLNVTGCTVVDDSKNVTTLECKLELPNVITPGLKDNLNDVLQIKGIENFPGSVLKIFNRWGKKIFESDDYNNTDHAWDGGKEAAGVYYYVLTVNYGEHGDCVEVKDFSGTVTILR
jgi:gliding motility-associated-like protein